MEPVGGVKVQGNVPCVRCGYGNECDTSGLSMIFGPGATVEFVGIKRFEEQLEAMNAARELGKKIAEHLKLKKQL